MKLFLKLVLTTALILAGYMGAVATATQAHRCGDFLKELYTDLPEGIEFVECVFKPELQADPFQADYRVEGKYAAEVEQFLIERIGMAPLKFVCCLWEPTNNGLGSYVDPKTQEKYYMGMWSEETLESRREDWEKIIYFYIRVNLYTNMDEV